MFCICDSSIILFLNTLYHFLMTELFRWGISSLWSLVLHRKNSWISPGTASKFQLIWNYLSASCEPTVRLSQNSVLVFLREYQVKPDTYFLFFFQGLNAWFYFLFRVICYLFLAVLALHCCVQAFSGWGERGSRRYSSLRCAGFAAVPALGASFRL